MMNASLEADRIHLFDRSKLRRWSVAEYQKFIDHGILTEEDKVELLEGHVVNKMPANPPHSFALMMLNDLMHTLLKKDYLVRCQQDTQIFENRPEPDLAIIPRNSKAYEARRPGPKDLLFVIEVADSSLEQDRIQKGRIYSQAGIPVYWVVNLIEGQIEVYTEPGEEAYRNRKDYRRGQAVPVEFDGKSFGTIPSEEILPEATSATT